MTAAQQQQAAKSFAAYWKDKGYEKGESQPFWLSLLRDVYGVEHPEQFIQFEEQVHLDHTSFIDGTIPATHVLIEQKGLGKDLNKPIKQSDGALLTPFEQAKRYILELPVSQHPRWVVTCNFSTFYVYDMERPRGEPEIIELANLEKEYYRLQFLVDAGNEHLKREMEVSIAAGEIVGLLYDAFYKQYANPESEHSLKSLNKLCVRLVFCLYAEDAGNLDYVCCWYKKASDLMKGTAIHSALVSTNSVSQGESVANLWEPLFSAGVHIDFAYRTFRWDSEAKIKAHVHCVIIGFSSGSTTSSKRIYTDNTYKTVNNICAYLVDAPNVFVESRKKPLWSMPPVVFGNMPNDGGFLSDYSNEDYQSIIEQYPDAKPLFKKFVGASEFINNKTRWCLWLKDVHPNLIKKIPPIIEAVENVKQLRLKSNREATKKLAAVPALFGEIRQPTTTYIIIPRHSSQNRKYIPMGFVSPDIICGDANLLMPNATLYHFGILMSNAHNAWVKTVCGRIKSDYRYSVNVVYNNFPWPNSTDIQVQKIESTAKAILDARALYPDWSLADLYDENFMPKELRKAHQDNDRAVMDAYGFTKGTAARTSESACVAELMKLYQQRVSAVQSR